MANATWSHSHSLSCPRCKTDPAAPFHLSSGASQTHEQTKDATVSFPEMGEQWGFPCSPSPLSRWRPSCTSLRRESASNDPPLEHSRCSSSAAIRSWNWREGQAWSRTATTTVGNNESWFCRSRRNSGAKRPPFPAFSVSQQTAAIVS